ncbi:MAG TPA: CDP-diacylglycerol--glycerol-3-phosphate 3-phosphatidyltransferase [Alphaproteobacteria bacterium]|nr:CDP-diacylglycerol--glycerol-3-phosphate 3-phosphatidyltransferase [Alphaproteobacteria bacterium]
MLYSLPNLLTLSRILAIPVLVGLFFVEAPWAPWAACLIFTAASITDYFDGYLARRMAIISTLGRLLDPIADKMLVAATLLSLVAFDRINGLAVIPALVILLREILISGLREFLAGMEAKGLPVSPLAKWKTGVQMTSLGILIVGDAGPEALPLVEIGAIGIWIAAALTAITGWAYVREGVRQAVAGKAAEHRPVAAKRGRTASTFG